MNTNDVLGIRPEDETFLTAAEKFFEQYARQGPEQKKVAAKFGVCYSKRKFARLEKGDRLRYRAKPDGKGLTVSVESTKTAVPEGDPCCEWEWEPEIPGLVCVAMCD